MSRKDTLNALFGLKAGDARAPETKAGAGGAGPDARRGDAGEADMLGAPNANGDARDGQLVAPNTGTPSQPPQPAAGGQAGSRERVRAGAVGAMGASLRDIAREADDMRARLASGDQVLEIDPALIDPAPFTDRLVIEVDPDFAALAASIRESGQQVPALVRPHPSRPGRFQAAYGHRRIRACLSLGLNVRAVVRQLDDAALAVAQGQENIARRDLSFIEKAVFAAGLESAGMARSAILQALATDKGDLSRYMAVARAVPIELVRAIGPAPKAGRARWLALGEALGAAGWRHAGAPDSIPQPGPHRRPHRSPAPGALPDRLLALLEKTAFARADSDARFAIVSKALAAGGESPARRKPDADASAPLAVSDQQGQTLAVLDTQGGRAVLTLSERGEPGFARFLAEQLPELHRRWRDAGSGQGN